MLSRRPALKGGLLLVRPEVRLPGTGAQQQKIGRHGSAYHQRERACLMAIHLPGVSGPARLPRLPNPQYFRKFSLEKFSFARRHAANTGESAPAGARHICER